MYGHINRDFQDRIMYSVKEGIFKEFFYDVINAVSEPVFVKDEEHRWVLFNDAFCQTMGHPAPALLGKSDYDFLPKEQADIFWRHDNEIFSSKTRVT